MSRILYRGGHVYSSYAPAATALLVQDGVITWVGSDAAASGLGAPDLTVQLDGAWLAPAFVDAHVHSIAAGLAMTVLELSAATGLQDVLDQVRAAAEQAGADALIWGTGWDETRWSPGAARRPPTPAELDRAGGGRPVYLARTDVHSAAASSRLLSAAGLAAVDGPVSGEAHHAVRRAARLLLSDRQREAAALAFFSAAARRGIGMVHECSGPDISDASELETTRRCAALHGIDLVAYWGEAGAVGVARAGELDAQPGGDLFVDGSLGSRTAAITRGYEDGYGCGTILIEPSEITDHLIHATRAGAQAGFHVIGDLALQAVLRGFGLAAREVGISALAGSRHRLEHLEMCEPSALPALARFGIIASVQPAFDARWGGSRGMYAERLGADRATAMNDLAGLAAAGIPLAFGSDAPVTPLDPWGALRAAVQPSNPRHALSARAAFAAHTRGGHRAARREGGVLQPGAAATFAIWAGPQDLSVAVPDDRVSAWSTDPRSGAPGIPSLTRPSPLCVATLVRGRIAYDGGVLGPLDVQPEPGDEVQA